MTDISYRVVPHGKNGFDVEMEKPDGRKQVVPGFHSEHEAEAWIIQAKRMIRDAGPWTPLAPRKPTPTVSEPAKPAPVSVAPPEPAPAAPRGKSKSAAPRSRVSASR